MPQSLSTIVGEVCEVVQAHLAEFRPPETEVAKTEGEIAVRVQLRKEPGGVAVGG